MAKAERKSTEGEAAAPAAEISPARLAAALEAAKVFKSGARPTPPQIAAAAADLDGYRLWLRAERGSRREARARYGRTVRGLKELLPDLRSIAADYAGLCELLPHAHRTLGYDQDARALGEMIDRITTLLPRLTRQAVGMQLTAEQLPSGRWLDIRNELRDVLRDLTGGARRVGYGEHGPLARFIVAVVPLVTGERPTPGAASQAYRRGDKSKPKQSP